MLAAALFMMLAVFDRSRSTTPSSQVLADEYRARC